MKNIFGDYCCLVTADATAVLYLFVKPAAKALVGLLLLILRLFLVADFPAQIVQGTLPAPNAYALLFAGNKIVELLFHLDNLVMWYLVLLQQFGNVLDAAVGTYHYKVGGVFLQRGHALLGHVTHTVTAVGLLLEEGLLHDGIRLFLDFLLLRLCHIAKIFGKDKKEMERLFHKNPKPMGFL